MKKSNIYAGAFALAMASVVLVTPGAEAPQGGHTAAEAAAYNQALHDIAAGCAQAPHVKYVIQLKGGLVAVTIACRIVAAERRNSL
jgi:hypothetical protein